MHKNFQSDDELIDMLSTGRCRHVVLQNRYRLRKYYDDDKLILKHHSIMNYKHDRSSI